MKPADDFALRRELRALRTGTPPARDLWPDIRPRLTAPRSRLRAPSWRWSGALAAGVLLALVAAVSFRIAGDGDAPVRAHAGAGAIDAGRPDDAAETLLAAYSEILALERAGFSAAGPRPATLGQAERLAAARELDASLTGLANALRIEPESQLLRRLMHQTLQQRRALTFDRPLT